MKLRKNKTRINRISKKKTESKQERKKNNQKKT